MTGDELANALRAVLAQYDAERLPPELPYTDVATSEALTAALDAGAPRIALAAGGTFQATGGFHVRAPLHLRGHGSTLIGLGGPALDIVPGTTDVLVEDLDGAASDNITAVFLLGHNDTSQASLELVPRRIVFDRVHVPRHRGQRAFEINAAEVQLRNCSAADVWSPAAVDSQAISIINTPGPVAVDGGEFSAGSEVIMVGGSAVRIPGLNPSNLTFRNLRLWRPVEWRTDGINRGVKNLFELKAGENVLVQDVLMEHHWPAAQPGWAIVLTPRNGQRIRSVTFDRLTLRSVGAGFNIMGLNDSTTQPPSPSMTSEIAVRNSTLLIDHVAWGGAGIVAQLLGGGLASDPALRLGVIIFDNCHMRTTNTYGRLMALGTRTQVESLAVTGSRFRVPYYVGRGPISTPDETPFAWFNELNVSGNTIGDPTTTCRTQYPSNTFVPGDEFDHYWP